MYISQVGQFWVLSLLVAGVPAHWEILNESTDQARLDLSLKEDNLLPAVQPLKNTQRFMGQASHMPVPDLQVQQNKTAAESWQSKAGSKLASPQDSPVSRSSPAEKTGESKTDDGIDLEGEGLLLVDRERGQPAPGQLPDMIKMSQVRTTDVVSPDMVRGVEKTKSRSQEKTVAEPGSQGTPDEMAFMSIKVACIEDSSWECQMFKQHFLAMQGDRKLSHRPSVYERTKRQASSNYKNVDTNNWNSRNLLGCEDGDCFSGDGDDTDANLVAPHFTFQSSTTTARPTNLTRNTLTEAKRQQLAQDLEDQLKTIFSNIPGFKCVKVDPKNIYIDSNDTLHFDDWEVTIDGSDKSYTGSSADNVTAMVNTAIKDANIQYKNIAVDGQQPIDDFNVTHAVEEVEKQAEDPCKMYPSPCPCGYGDCQPQPPNTGNSTGIRLRCTDNCLNYSDCSNHGQCRKDIAGNAYCSCTGSWIGPYCDKENKTTSDQDNIRSPEYTISQTSKFRTNLTNEDLTPEKRQEIARNLTEELKNTLATFPGLKNITINPDDIYVDGGVLVVPWNMTIDSGNPAYTGKTAQQIADVVRDSLQNLGDSYRNNVTIDGRHPINDLDFVDAAQQVEKQAKDPCSTHSCPIGYTICEALSPTQIQCVHNCNSRSTECQNGGQCQLDSAGDAVCQCAEGYAGADCETEDSSLDAGQIAGVAAGSLLLMGAAAGTAGMMMMGARRNQNVEFTEYADEQSSDQASYPSNLVYTIDRPGVDKSPMAIYGQSAGPYSANATTPSSYATLSNSGGDNVPADVINSQA